MNTRMPRNSAFTLIECMAYIAILAIVMTLAMTAYGRCAHQSARLQKVASDIAAVLDAGEVWRSDVRRATNDIKTEKVTDGDHWIIPQAGGDITYALHSGVLTRRSHGSTVTLLKSVQGCQVTKDVRQHVTGWRWEVELRSLDKNPKVRPLFSFQAVSTGGSK